MISPSPVLTVAARLKAHVDAGKTRLPLLPAAVTQVLAEAKREDADARKLAELVRRDAALAANVLRVAGSTFYARGAPLKSLAQAVGRLGTGALRQIALLVAGQTTAFRVPGHEARVRTMFRHAFATALFAQEIARKRRESVEEAFLAGLFHDVGKPVLLASLVELKCAIDAESLAAVDELHPEMGAKVLASWSLAPAAQAAARYHHDQNPPPAAAGWAHLVALADALAHTALDEEPSPEGHRTLAALEIYPEDLAALLAHKDAIIQAVQEIA